MKANAEVLADRAPESAELFDRPAMELGVAGEAEPLLAFEEAFEIGESAFANTLAARFPEQRAFGDRLAHGAHRSAETVPHVGACRRGSKSRNGGRARIRAKGTLPS